MTPRAISLTERVKEPVSSASTKWSMPANAVRAFISAFERIGYGIDSLKASSGLGDDDLDDPDARISCERLGALVLRAQQERFTPNLGLELAKVTPLGSYPLLDYLILTAGTVGEGIRQFASYCRLIGDPVTVNLNENIDPVRIEFTKSAAPFSIEFSISLMIFHFRNETDGRFAAASFVHEPDDAAALERAYGCPVQAAATWNGISLSQDAWSLPLRRGDPVLRQVLETQGNEILKRLPARDGLAYQVQRALATRVPGGDTSISALARHFAMSARTLQRRLAAEGISYQELREEARKEAARRYIAESRLTVAEVAYLIGYSEPAPFHRAFKRWYRMTPEAFRGTRRTAIAEV